jgi:type VI secretion system protein ImpB
LAESTQHKLDRVRRPRVQITYDLEIAGASVERELPFVMGVLADLSGQPAYPPAPLRERKFIEIDAGNFSEVMASIQPRVSILVDNKITDAGGLFSADIEFRSMEDFSPAHIVTQVPAMRKLYEVRRRLTDLLAKLDGSGNLENQLQKIAQDPVALQKIRAEGEPRHG